jgi:hypothetical protein
MAESESQALTASVGEGQDSKAHLFVFTNDKAGMTGVDKEHTNRVIYEVSSTISLLHRTVAFVTQIADCLTASSFADVERQPILQAC